MVIKSWNEFFNRGWLLDKTTFLYLILKEDVGAFQTFDDFVIELDIIVERDPALGLQVFCTLVQDRLAIDDSESAHNGLECLPG